MTKPTPDPAIGTRPRRRLRAMAAAILIVGVCASPPRPVAAAPQAAQVPPTIADTADRTPAGHRFVVPAGWAQSRRDGLVLLEAPEPGSRVALIEVEADTAEAAVARAWSAYGGDATAELLYSVPVANRAGWHDGRRFVYQAPSGSSRSLTALAMRYGDAWAVRIEDLAASVAGRRAADLRLIRDEFLPAGYVRESFAGRRAHPLDPARIAELSRFIEESRTLLGVPGISVGIVQDGNVVFAGGFGVRELGRPETVDADTLYLTASTTKQLTTLMLGKLVDEGRFGWETPVIELLPSFRLADPDVTRQVRLRHLVCACTGLPYRNLDWEFAPANAPASLTFDILSRMRSTSAFGTTYQYSNPIVAAAGLVGGHLAYPELELGAAYDRAMRTRVFDPLGMTRTTFDFDEAMQGNYAPSHGVSPSIGLAPVEPVRDRQIHALRPTGGAWSNVNDLIAYLKVELSRGRLEDGTRYISEASLTARWAPQIPTGRFSWYGMGLETDVSSGTPMVFHGGRFYGQRSNVVWFPEHGVGLVILMNASTGNVLMDAFPRKLLEILFDGEPEAESMVRAASATDREQRAALRRSLHIPAAPEHARVLASRYRNAFLGEVHVVETEEGTTFDFGAWSAPVASRETAAGVIEFVVDTPSPPVPFSAGRLGDRRTLTVRDAQNEYVFIEADLPMTAAPVR